MNELTQEKCQTCHADSPRVEGDEMRVLLQLLPEWRVVTRDEVPQLERRFEFPDFAQALAFTNRVGQLAEAEDHHPRLTVEWGSVVVTWWTHKIRGLHRNDFVMAARTDGL
ncbi:MAG: 4a-hydroxytetrahydrobiopterin dehydratase [Chromatiales bacterium]|jgi:4a-hydroxytetrahydrobiopterin dehydratase